jgi:2-polyprenyl-6-methoxyphenol hydroxylase-like FAD-dependent oxidoreductase
MTMQAENSSIDVLICGAGAAGLALAVDLARRGVRFRLIDKLAAPFTGSRGKGIQPRTLEVFEDFGIVDRIAALGGPYPAQREYRDDGSHVDSLLTAPAERRVSEPFDTPLMLPQFLTERVLRERLLELGHRPHFGCELQEIVQDDAGVTARVAGPHGMQGVRARYLIGTDGGRSVVRHLLAVDFPGKTLGVRAVVADVALTGLGRDAWHRFNEGSMKDQVSFCPLAGTDLFQLQAPVSLEGEIDLSAAGLNEFQRRRTGRADIVIQSVSWASVYSMNARLADRYRVGAVFLAGDAAHIHPPTGGQGLNTSIQDSYNLGWKLAAVLAGAPDALLDTYEAERRPIAAHMLGLATQLLDAQKRGSMRRGREVHQLDLGYPGSSLALQCPHRDMGAAAGDRAPDAQFGGAAGRPVRLFDLCNGPHWVLLAYHADRSLVPTRPNLHIHHVAAHGELADPCGHLRDGYGVVAGDWILIRPDGYIGAVVASEHVPALEMYMSAVGVIET